MPEQAEDCGNGHSTGMGHPRSPSQTANINSHMENNKKRVGSAKYYDIATALMGKGKTVDLEELFVAAARDGDYERIEDFLLRSGKDHMISIDVKDKRTGNTPLIWAAKRGHTKIVQLLLKHGADITLRNYESQTAIEVASSTIKTLLLDSVERSTESSHRLLLQAAWQGNLKVLRKLLNENRVRDINCQNGDGLTPLLLVTRDIQMFEQLSTQLNKPYNPAECVAELLNHRANLHTIDEGGKTCLHYASQSKAMLAQTVVQTLITGAPNIDIQDKRLFTPIHCASQIGNVECIEVLIEGGSSVNHKGFAGTTPLHITAYNDHEKAACCLLRHGADITITDDRGLTAVDLARGKKMKNTLKEAWSEATMNRTPTSLGPLKTASREDLRNSSEEFSKKRKSSGDVIYDNMPANPFANTKSTSRGKMVTRHLSLKDKANKAEEIMMKDIENGNFTPGPYVKDGVRRLGLVRSQRPSPLPKGVDRLPAISPDSLSADRNTESPAFSRNSRLRRSLDETRLSSSRGSKNKLATFPMANSSKKVTPLSTKDGGMQVVSLADDLENVQSSRLTPASPRQIYQKHRRSGSDTMASPNLADIAASCDPYLLQKGSSVNLNCQQLSQSADFGEHCVYSPRLAPLQRAPLEREITCVSLQNEGASNKSVVLDLDRMGLINKCQTPVQNVPLYPTSSKVLPPTPTMLGHKTHSCLESRMTNHPESDESSKEVSPRSDEETERMNNKKEVHLAFETSSLLRSRSILKEEFVLEESRPRDFILQSTSDDSSNGNKDRSSVSSGEMSPWENNKSVAKQQKQQPKCQNAKPSVPNDAFSGNGKCSVVSVNAQSKLKPNLRTVSSKRDISVNSSVKTNSTNTSKEKGNGGKGKVAIHSQSLGAKTILPEDKSSKTVSPTGEGSTVKSSGKSNKENNNGAKQRTSQKNESVTPSISKAPMQVFSTKLISNVRDEVRKMRDAKIDDDGVYCEQQIPENKQKNNDKTNVNNSATNTGENHCSVTQNVSRTLDQTGSNEKENKSGNPVPSYLLPTQSSSSRHHISREGRSQSVATGSETTRKSMVTNNNTYSRASNLKTTSGSLRDSSVADLKQVPTSQSSSALTSYKQNTFVSNSQASRNIQDKRSANGAQQNSSGIKKSQSDTSISAETNETVPNSAVRSSRKSRSVSLDLNGSSKSQDKISDPSSSSKSSSIKSVSMSTLHETKSSGINVTLKSQSETHMEETKTQESSACVDSPRKSSKLQYKPASAGKPPLVEIVPAGTPRTAKSKCIDSEVIMPVQTPVIVNPFEDMLPYQVDLQNTKSSTSSKKANEKGVSATSYGYIVTKPTLERSKTIASNSKSTSKGKRSSSKEPKPTSAGTSRQGGRRRGAKSKDSKLSDDGGNGRPKSGKKRVKSGKRRKKLTSDTVLSKQAAQSDVALISGIGWHVATSCVDKSDVTVVKTVGSDTDSSDNEFDENPGLLQVPQALDPMSNQSTPRFLEVKAVEKHRKELAVMSNDGYPPMNLDMTQASLPVKFDLSHMLQRENSQVSLPADFSTLIQKLATNKKPNEYVEPASEIDVTTDAIHRQILMGKLTPIPESPSLRSTAMIHKTMEAIEKFDHNVQEETLNNLLGLVKDESVDPTPRQDLPQKFSAKSSSRKSSSQSSLNNSAKRQQHGSASLSYSASSRRFSSGEKCTSTSSKNRSSVHSVKSDRSENKRSASKSERGSATNQKSLASKPDRIIIKESSMVKDLVSPSDVSVQHNEKAQNVIPSPPQVPKLKNLVETDSDSDDSWGENFNKKEPISTRRERVFSETKSDDKDEECITEAINDIMSNTLPSSTSTLRSVKSVKSAKSLSSTFSEADKHLLLRLSTQNDSPFYPKMSTSANERVRQSGSLEDLTAPHPTNPNLLRVFHAEKYQLGQKMKAMIDAGADASKVKAMADTDNEAKQIAKIMNSFRNMELYAGPSSVKTPGKDNSHILKPEVSSADPYIGRKPPLARPNSAGAGKVKSAGRFTEIKSEKKTQKTDKDQTLRQSGPAKEEKVIRRSADTHNLRGSTYNDTAEQELTDLIRTVTQDNESFGQGEGPSRSGSACTTISSQSSIEDTIQWKKGNVLGKGAFGTVWCGLTNEGQLIAVKQIELNTVDKDKAKREYEKVQEEVELLKTISHKNIVGYLGTSLEENIVSIFMQFVPGGSIASILARFGALDEAVFRRYTRQILEGVQYLHANDVIHRDIKGGNVMLMPNGIIKLIDFGCAKRLCINLSMGQSQILKSMKGTPYWMAPEVVNETGHGKKSDIWSVGCTIFEMATRKPPWADMNPMAAIFAIGSEKPVPKLPAKFSKDALMFVDDCLTRDQNKRPSASQLLQNVFISRRKGSKK